MNLLQPLDSLLGSQAKLHVLRTLYRAAGPLAGREIGRRAGVGSGHISRVLRELAAMGILAQEQHGAVRLYSLPRAPHPLLAGVLDLFYAEEQRRCRIVEQLARTHEAIVAIILFGSEARGAVSAESDTDLLIVVQRGSKTGVEESLASALPGIGEAELIALSWFVVDLDDIARWEREGHALWRNIRQEGQSLTGASIEEVRHLCLSGATG